MVGHGQLGHREGQGNGLGRNSRGGAGQPPDLGGQDRPQKRGVGQTAAELLGHDCHFDGRGQRRAIGSGLPQLPPTGGRDGRLELVGPLEVVQLSYGVRTQPADDLDGGIAECLLLGGEPDVH
jgi:hypothetical protein